MCMELQHARSCSSGWQLTDRIPSCCPGLSEMNRSTDQASCSSSSSGSSEAIGQWLLLATAGQAAVLNSINFHWAALCGEERSAASLHYDSLQASSAGHKLLFCFLGAYLVASVSSTFEAGWLPPTPRLVVHTFCSGTCRVSLSNGNLLTDTDAIRSIASTCRTHCGRCGLKPPFHAHAFITPICFGVPLHFMSLLKPKKRSRRRRGRSRSTERQRV